MNRTITQVLFGLFLCPIGDNAVEGKFNSAFPKVNKQVKCVGQELPLSFFFFGSCCLHPFILQ